MINKFQKAFLKTAQNFGDIFTKKSLDDDILADIEDKLIMADFGPKLAHDITEKIKKIKFEKDIDKEKLITLIIDYLASLLTDAEKEFPPFAQKNDLQIILVLGVNGSGKTTLIGKLGHMAKSQGKKCLFAACDTFRAAAIEQLSIWGERANIDVFAMPQKSDPAAVAFKAIQKAKDENYNIVFIDSSGRLHNKSDLMAELAKIERSIEKSAQKKSDERILVMDATIGQNAVNQLNEFDKIIDVSGLVMTKLDGSTKGGILFPLYFAKEKPIYYISTGEKIDDISEFKVKEYLRAIFN